MGNEILKGALMQSDMDTETGVVSTAAFNAAVAPVSRETVEAIVDGEYEESTEGGAN